MNPAWRNRRSPYFLTALAIAMTFFALIRPDHSPIDRHLARLDYLRRGPFLEPRNINEWFSLGGARFVHWTFGQRISGQATTYNTWADALEAEQQALIRLGHYQRIWINLPDATSLRSPALEATSVGQTAYTMHGDIRRSTQIRVTARPDQIHEFIMAVAGIPR